MQIYLRLALWKFVAGDPIVIGWTVTIGYLLSSRLFAIAGNDGQW